MMILDDTSNDHRDTVLGPIVKKRDVSGIV
jgi:hypothetical protein